MTVAVFVTNANDAECLIPWGVHFASAEHSELLVVCPRKSKGKHRWDSLEVSGQDDNVLHRSVFDVLSRQAGDRVVLKQEIASGNESTDRDRVAIETREFTAPNPEAAFVEEIGDLGITTLLLPGHMPVKGDHNDDKSWSQVLFTEAPCRVVAIRGLAPDVSQPLRILVASEEEISTDEVLALSKACQLARSSGHDETSNKGTVTLLYVRPDDDVVASHVAEKHLQQLEKSVSEKIISIETRIELADSICEGINRLSLELFDLIIVGTRNAKTIRALMRDLDSPEGTLGFSLATMRESVPLADQMWSRFKNAIRSRVPQLDREHRVKLVDQLQSSSQFNFDFIALISLSTLIAALGLVKNSGAVVIGAMLVAPLMTPLVAMGFALVQANLKLLRSALKSVLLGFTVAMLIGTIVGLILRLGVPDYAIMDEMRDRGLPNLLDLVVALASGVAGAYAMGRPNLVSAIPGVAIAAALVPPIATAGLALALGDLELCGGASLLFFTNIVAIVLGTAMTFWAVGISTRVSADHRPPQNWPRYLFLAFVVLSFLLAIEMFVFNSLGSENMGGENMGGENSGTEFERRESSSGSNIQKLLEVD